MQPEPGRGCEEGQEVPRGGVKRMKRTRDDVLYTAAADSYYKSHADIKIRPSVSGSDEGTAAD